MPTENRRVATYLPKELDDRFKAFIADRQLKGDSQALIVILSEFLGVGLPVAQKVDYSGFVKLEQLSELLTRVSELAEAFEKSKASSAVNLLLGKMQRLESRMESLENSEGLSKESKPEVPPGQLDLLADSRSRLPSNSKSELLEIEQSSLLSSIQSESVSLKEGELPDESLDESKNKFQEDRGWLSTRECWERLGEPVLYGSFRKYSPEKLYQQYGIHADLERKAAGKYNSHWLRLPDDRETLSQVSPLPEGSERSEEG